MQILILLISINIQDMQVQNCRTIHIQTLEFTQTKSSVIDGRSLWRNGNKILAYEQNCRATTIPVLFGNGFLSAVFQAYNTHGDIKFTPDDVWIAIMLYFSEYVNENAEKLRSAFVTHQGQKELKVQTKNELLQTQWDEFFTLMIAEIKKNTTKGVTETFECDFSTTGRVEKIISTAVIMNTYKKYFTYTRIMTFCGIQNVHFQGTLEDWQKILKKLKDLNTYDVDGKLKQYIRKVSQILQKFIETYQGKVDLEFWNKIVHRTRGGSGMPAKFTGWITQLFGYCESVEEAKMQEINFDIKVVNKITNITKTVKLVGGFRGVCKQGRIYRPHLSMAICDGPQREQRTIRPFQDYL